MRPFSLLAAVAVAALGGVSLPHAAAQGGGDLAVIKERLLASFLVQTNVSGAEADVEGFLAVLTPEGTFSDLNYSVGVASGWGGYDHCLRLSEMSSIYFTPNSSRYYKNATLLAGIRAAWLTFWLTHLPVNEANWWYQAIAVPHAIGQLSLQFSDSMTPEQATNATLVMDGAVWESWSSTGTNAVDIGLGRIYNGIFNNNETMVSGAFAKIGTTFSYSYGPAPVSPEGPKPDGAFMQHGAQLYLGNYGASWVKSCLTLVAVAANTTFNISGAGYDVVTHVALDGCQAAIHFPSLMWDVAVIGRQVTGPGGQSVPSQGGVDLLPPAVIRGAGGARGGELAAFADRLESPTSAPPLPPSFTVFYTSDYAVQRRSTYMMSVRMISERTAGGECINAQGLQSLHAADGVMYVYKSGLEYNNIAPTWDWEKLPGTTVQVGGTALNCSTADGNGYLPNVGGVTADGLTGLAYMDFLAARYGQNLTAKKAYFFFEGTLLALGNSITTAPGFHVTTTLESRLLDTAAGVRVTTTGPSGWTTLPAGNTSFPLPSAPPAPGAAPSLMAYHDGIGYGIFVPPASSSRNSTTSTTSSSSAYPPSSSLNILNRDVTGNWSSVGTSKGSVTNGMFTAWIEHGTPPVADATYAYFVWPDTPFDSLNARAAADAARYIITRNDAHAQAVYDSVDHVLTAVLYDNETALAVPASIAAGCTLQMPFPAGVIVNAYVNATTGNNTLRIQFSTPTDVLSLDHTYYFFVQTGASLVPCEWPNCPTQHEENKGYVGPPGLKYSCFANGTVAFVNPPSQADMSAWNNTNGIVPPIACSLAA